MAKQTPTGVRVSSLLPEKKLRDATVTFDGGAQAHLTVDENQLTVKRMRQISRAEQTGDTDAIFEFFFDAIKAWDLLDDNDEPLPLTEEAIGDWPVSFFSYILQNVTIIGQPDPKAPTAI